MDAACAALNEALPHAGQGFWMEPPFWCDYGWNITAGKNLYMNHGCVILDAGGVTFGDDVQVGPQCGFHTSGHPLDAGGAAAGPGVRQAHPGGQRCVVRRRLAM